MWRVLIAGFVLLGAVFVAVALGTLNPFVLVGAVALIAPAAYFGFVVAVRVWKLEDGSLEIHTLLFIRRRVAPSELGAPRIRKRYRSIHGDLHAPRIWVPVKGRWPIYFDLLGRILDRSALLSVLGVRAVELKTAD